MNKIALFLLCLIATNAFAFNLNRPANKLDEPLGKHTLLIPYGFYNGNTGAAAALVFATNGYLQPQMTTLANVFVGTNGTSNFFLSALDTRVPGFDRIFVDTLVMFADWKETESFQTGNPDFINEEAGTNDSDKDNFVEADGTDRHFRLKFKYLLPIGDGKAEPIHTFAVQNGMLVKGYEAGGRAWNPLSSGRTTVQLEPFYRSQEFEDEFDSTFDSKTMGVKFSIEYDNTDWYKNPSYGSRQRFSVSRDWGAEEESNTWTSVSFQYSKYIPLALNKKTRQRVLALNFWTSDVPTWNSSHTDDETGRERLHRAPNFDGSTLGGLDRQRGYSTNRFHDRSAINYAVEYRHAPVANPFPRIPLINKLYIPWWEWLAFAELGRVADNWSFNDLHKSMKVSVGMGIRVSVEGLIVRADAAASEDGAEVQMFFGHSF